jgi:hypothetical protein
MNAKELSGIMSKTFVVLSVGLVTLGTILLQARRPLWKPPAQSTAARGESSDNGPTRRGFPKLSEPLAAKIVGDYGRVPLSFEANQGQTDPEVRFLSRGGGYTLFLTPGEAVLALRRGTWAGPSSGTERKPCLHKLQAGAAKDKFSAAAQNGQTVLRMGLLGASPAPEISGIDALPGKSNYLRGNDPAQWRTDLPTYARVKYGDVYPGVDLIYYGNQRQLEYDFVVAAGADPGRIQFAITGAEGMEVAESGDLILHAKGGLVSLHKPVAYQQDATGRREVQASYVLKSTSKVRFQVTGYDAGKPLVIDPVLSYSTYLGGTGNDFADAITVDAAGNAYVTGSTGSSDFPSKNPEQPRLAGNSDVFVAKLDPTGSTLVYSTFLGGGGDDVGTGIAVDNTGNAYVTGSTSSANFPTSAGAFQTALKEGQSAFVTKLAADGKSLLYSTYLGGSGVTESNASGIVVDASGNAFVAGSTSSTTFPATASAFQSALKGSLDAFVAKIDTTKGGAASLIYSSYLGGSGNDGASGIAVDSSGNVYLTGGTNSADYPMTPSAFQAALGNPNSNAFLTVIDPSKSGAASLVYSTYFGGGGTANGDSGSAIAVNAAAGVYIAGTATSSNFPTTPGGFQTGNRGGVDGFVAKFDTSKSGAASLVYSTLLGGGSGLPLQDDFILGIAVDAGGNAYVVGQTSSTDFPLSHPFQSSLVLQDCGVGYYGDITPCGDTAFVTKLNSTGSALVYSTYLGAIGGDFETGRAIAVDNAGNAYVAGNTSSSYLLVTPGASQTASGGNSDAFVAKIGPADAAGFSVAAGFGPIPLSFPDEGVGGTSPPRAFAAANTGSGTLIITGVTASGDFAQTNDCGGAVAAGKACTLNITFSPTAAGKRTGSITFTDNAASNPQTITLSGNGVVGLAATLSSAKLDFGSFSVGVGSPQQIVFFTNTGSTPLTIFGTPLVGTNPNDFFLSTDCGGSLLVGAHCSISVSFVPSAIGNRTATLQVLDNSAQSPRTVPLTGIGTAQPTVSVSPSSPNFLAQIVGTKSASQPVILSAGGSGQLGISGIGTSGDFVETDNCPRLPSLLTGGGSCTINVFFAPAAVGARTGTLVIADNATDSPQMVVLSGQGVDFSLAPASGSTTSATITAGLTASYNLSLAGTSGFSGSVSLACSGAPLRSTCTMSPNSVQLSGTTPANATVMVTTTANGLVLPIGRPLPFFPLGVVRVVVAWMLFLLTLMLLVRALRLRAGGRRRAWVSLAVAVFFAALSVGCGGGSSSPPPPQGTPAGTFQIVVTGSSGGANRNTTLTLVVK